MPIGPAATSARNSWRVMRHSLMHSNSFRFEPVERPAGVEGLPLDHRVPLKRGHRIVEPLDLQACWTPLGRHAHFILAILAGERQLADDPLVFVTAESPAEHANVPVIALTAIHRRGGCAVWR